MFNHLESIHGWLAPADRKGWLYSVPICRMLVLSWRYSFLYSFLKENFLNFIFLSWRGLLVPHWHFHTTVLALFCKNAHTVKTLAFGSTILSVPLCYYYLPNLCLRTQILMSASHVTFLMLTLSILAAGFLELFISSHLHFLHNLSHVFSLSLSGLCYHPEQFYLKNQQLGLLTGLVLGGSFSFFCWAGSLNSLDHLHNFSLISVSLLDSLPCPIYSPCSVTLSTPLLISSILLPYYPFDTTCLAFLGELTTDQVCWASLQKKQQGRVVSLRVHDQDLQQDIIKVANLSPAEGFQLLRGKALQKWLI